MKLNVCLASSTAAPIILTLMAFVHRKSVESAIQANLALMRAHNFHVATSSIQTAF